MTDSSWTTKNKNDKPNSDGDSNEEETSPKAGQQSASDMVAAGISGMQFSFDVTSSSSRTKDHTFDQKERHRIENDSHGYVESKLTDNHSTSSDFSLAIQAGTNDNEISISSSADDDVYYDHLVTSYSAVLESNSYYDYIQPKSGLSTDHYVKDISSGYEFGLGGDTHLKRLSCSDWHVVASTGHLKTCQTIVEHPISTQ